MHNCICEAVRNTYYNSIKNEYHQYIRCGLGLAFSIHTQRIGWQRSCKTTTDLFRKIISIIHNQSVNDYAVYAAGNLSCA